MGIWPLDRLVARAGMDVVAGFKCNEAIEEGGRVTGSTGHPTAISTNAPDSPREDKGVATNSPSGSTDVEDAVAYSNDEAPSEAFSSENNIIENSLDELLPLRFAIALPSSLCISQMQMKAHMIPPRGTLQCSMVPQFHEHLQEEGESGDFNRFLALLEIILGRKQKRQQPFLDFTKSKILTSNAYTKRCERLLVQRQARADEVRRKTQEREVSKE